MNVRPAICIIENDCLLTMHYRYGETDVYNLPGGNLEFGEEMTDCLARELVEELGVSITIGEMLCLAEIVIKEKHKHTLHVIFKGKITNGTPALNPKETTALNIKWLPIAELTNVHLYPTIALSLQKAIQNELPNPFLGRIIQPWM